jgi:transcriptional regulator with XRE-family HTH domain
MTRPPLNEIFKYNHKKAKDQAIYKARLQYGYTLRDIAEFIGVYYTKVSRTIINKIEREDKK